MKILTFQKRLKAIVIVGLFVSILQPGVLKTVYGYCGHCGQSSSTSPGSSTKTPGSSTTSRGTPPINSNLTPTQPLPTNVQATPDWGWWWEKTTAYPKFVGDFWWNEAPDIISGGGWQWRDAETVPGGKMMQYTQGAVLGSALTAVGGYAAYYGAPVVSSAYSTASGYYSSIVSSATALETTIWQNAAYYAPATTSTVLTNIARGPYGMERINKIKDYVGWTLGAPYTGGAPPGPLDAIGLQDAASKAEKYAAQAKSTGSEITNEIDNKISNAASVAKERATQLYNKYWADQDEE